MSTLLTAVGDIHGCSEQLQKILDLPELQEERQVVFLGDYVDVGPNSKKVIELLTNFRSQNPRATFLLGNHEIEMLNYLKTGDFARYAQQGGLSTIRSYCGPIVGNVHEAFTSAVPNEHLAFLSDLELYLDTGDYFFSHAGFDPDQPLDRSIRSLAATSHDVTRLKGGLSDKTVVCGHYYQKSGLPAICPKFIGLDTGCGTLRGPLTALRLPSMEYRQAPVAE